MDNQRMRMLSLFGDNESDPLSQRYLEEERHRHLLSHNTAYYDTINSLTVVKADGWIYTFTVLSYKIQSDTSLVFYGSQGEQLTYPASGSGWKITGAEEAQGHSSSLFSRRMLNTEREDALDDDAHRALHAADFQRRLDEDSSLCDASVDSPCKTCIEREDSWCAGSAWDKFCKSGCAGPTSYMANGCAAECAEPKIVSVKAKKTAEVEKETPVDCKVSDAWDGSGYNCQFLGEKGITNDPICLADRSCGCRKKWIRSIVTHPEHGGAVCPATEEMRDCSCIDVPTHRCGDGHVVEGVEECDDGNTFNGDGCSSTCQREDGWSCSGGNSFTPSTCTASSCGDGKRTGLEECDDDNNVDGDGCSADCKVEQWWDCDTAAAPNDMGGQTTCQCMRVRKDYRDMSQAEKDLYIEAVNALKTSGVYDKLVQTHAELGNKAYAHGTSGFLPWHRKYLMEYENALRGQSAKYNCVTVPYWDWAEDTDICSANGGCTAFHDHSSILQDFGGPGSQECSTAPHSGTISCSSLPAEYQAKCQATGSTFAHTATCEGMKTWGSTGAGAKTCSAEEKAKGCVDFAASQVGCVMTGPFAGWMSPEFGEEVNSANPPSCLSRGVNWEIASQGYLTGSQRLQEIIVKNKDYGTYSGFRAAIESTPHANPHNLLGGHIRSFSSPADPLFFSHHAFIDKVWSMWQNCHDHDEVESNSIGTDQYRGAKGGDGPTDPMVFNFPGGSPGDSKCQKSDSTGCSVCVNSADGWCSSNDWDSQCEGLCGSSCSAQCGSSVVSPKTVIGTWMDSDGEDGKTALPLKYHSIHDMPGGNNYLYAPDQFDLKMGAQSAICNYAESKVHGQQWKKNRRVLQSYTNHGFEEGDHPIDKMSRIHKAADKKARHLVEDLVTDECGCYSAADGSWRSEPALDDEGFCALVNYLDENDEILFTYTPCSCADGKFPNADGNKCISFLPTDVEITDPDLKAILDYYENYSLQLMAENKFVKPADSLNAVMSTLVQRECQLLFNEKNGIKMEDKVGDSTTENGSGKRPGSDRFNFLKNWNMKEEIDAGAANDPCDGVGGPLPL
jgi:cysteine-rich repeat protein